MDSSHPLDELRDALAEPPAEQAQPPVPEPLEPGTILGTPTLGQKDLVFFTTGVGGAGGAGMPNTWAQHYNAQLNSIDSHLEETKRRYLEITASCKQQDTLIHLQTERIKELEGQIQKVLARETREKWFQKLRRALVPWLT